MFIRDEFLKPEAATDCKLFAGNNPSKNSQGTRDLQARRRLPITRPPIIITSISNTIDHARDGKNDEHAWINRRKPQITQGTYWVLVLLCYQRDYVCACLEKDVMSA